MKIGKIPIVTSFSQHYNYYMQDFLIPRENNLLFIQKLQNPKENVTKIEVA